MTVVNWCDFDGVNETNRSEGQTVVKCSDFWLEKACDIDEEFCRP